MLYNSGSMWPSVVVHEHWPVSQCMIVEMGDYAWSEHIVAVFLACQITIKNVQVQLTVKGKTTPDSYTPAVLNGRCRARLDMSRSSLGVVLRGLHARGRSVTFPVWRKRCISRTMMEWLTLKWSATLLWLKPLLCMPTACHLSGMVNFRHTIPNQ